MRWSLARAGLIIGASTLAVACSGDGDTSPSTPTVVPTTIGSTTTGAPAAPTTTTTATTTTTVEPVDTTAAPTTAVTETTTPSTTLPEGVPPRVTFPDDPDKQAVVDAAYAYFDTLRAASAAPGDSGLRDELASTMTEPLAPRVVGFLDELAAAGERVVAGQNISSSIEVWDFTLEIFEGAVGPAATFDACVVDADVRVAVDAAGVESVIDDSVSSAAQTFQLVIVDGDWRVRDIQRFGRFEGQVGCD